MQEGEWRHVDQVSSHPFLGEIMGGSCFGNIRIPSWHTSVGAPLPPGPRRQEKEQIGGNISLGGVGILEKNSTGKSAESGKSGVFSITSKKSSLAGVEIVLGKVWATWLEEDHGLR